MQPSIYHRIHPFNSIGNIFTNIELITWSNDRWVYIILPVNCSVLCLFLSVTTIVGDARCCIDVGKSDSLLTWRRRVSRRVSLALIFWASCLPVTTQNTMAKVIIIQLPDAKSLAIAENKTLYQIYWPFDNKKFNNNFRRHRIYHSYKFPQKSK